MSAFKDGRYPLALDEERHLKLSLNAIDEIQERFGSFDNIDEIISGPKGVKHLKWLLAMLLNEGAAEDEPPLTEQEVGRLVHAGNLNDVKVAMFKAFAIGNAGSDQPPEDDDEDFEDDADDDAGNAEAGGSASTSPA